MKLKFQKEKVIIVLTVLVDVIGMGVVIPVLPFYVESFGVSSMVVTMLFSVFSLFSFFSGPMLGSISDRVGRRPALIVSIMSSAIGWLIFASANSVWVLFLGRIIDGMAAGNFSIAQSYLADLARNPKERTSNMGLIGATFGIGFIIGPMIGGMLGSISHGAPFWFVGGLATINMFGAYFFLPESHKQLQKRKKIRLNPLVPIARAVSDKNLRSRYLAWMFFGIAVAIQQSIFALYLNAAFGFTEAFIGTIFTAMGVIMALNQGFLLRVFWLKRFKEHALEIWMFPAFALGFLFMGIRFLPVFFIGLIVIVFCQSVLRVFLSSSVSGIAGSQKQGEVMGIMNSIMSLTLIFSPLVGGLLFQMNISYPFLVSAVSLMVAFYVMKKFTKPASQYVESKF